MNGLRDKYNIEPYNKKWDLLTTGGKLEMKWEKDKIFRVEDKETKEIEDVKDTDSVHSVRDENDAELDGEDLDDLMDMMK